MSGGLLALLRMKAKSELGIRCHTLLKLHSVERKHIRRGGPRSVIAKIRLLRHHGHFGHNLETEDRPIQLREGKYDAATDSLNLSSGYSPCCKVQVVMVEP